MSNKEQICARIEEVGIIPAIRVSSASEALFAAEAILDSGIPVLEVTMTVPGAVEVIHELVKNHGDLIAGAGTVFDIETAQKCVDAGAKFLTSPGLDLEILNFALKHNTVVFPGAMTPTEIATTWRAGADFVKVFPCAQLGGADYIKALQSPFPHVRLIASGGVSQQTAGEFILAGASAVGVGRDLIQPRAIERRERDWIRELARRFLRIVKDAREQKRGWHPAEA